MHKYFEQKSRKLAFALARYTCFFALVFSINFFGDYSVANAASQLGTCLDGSNTCSNRIFSKYKGSKPKLKYVFESSSGLGDISHSQATGIVVSSFQTWENVDTAKIRFKPANFAPMPDITTSNFIPFISPSQPLGFSPIIFDQDGSIFLDLFGEGSQAQILAVAGPSFIIPERKKILESRGFFNGFLFSLANRNNSTLNSLISDFQTTALHELGHMFGLDHTQLNSDVDVAGNVSLFSTIPVMYPLLRNTSNQLLPDDIASISNIYRKGKFKKNFGTLKGAVTSTGGSAIKGAVVIAYRIDSGNPRTNAVSGPTDFKAANNGNYKLPGLAPGQYIVKVESILSNFNGASSVGPHQPQLSGIANGFYNGPGQPLLDITLDEALNQIGAAGIIQIKAKKSKKLNITAVN